MIVAAHAWFVKAAFGAVDSGVSFRSVFSAGCYLGGTSFLLCTVLGAGFLIVLPRLLPKLRRERNMPSRELGRPKFSMWLLAGVPPWIVIFKAIHSYYVLLSALSGTSLWRAIGSWLGGTMGFMIAMLLVGVWLDPALLFDLHLPRWFVVHRPLRPGPAPGGRRNLSDAIHVSGLLLVSSREIDPPCATGLEHSLVRCLLEIHLR